MMPEGGIHATPEGRFQKPGDVTLNRGMLSNALFGKKERAAQAQHKEASEQVSLNEKAAEEAAKKKQKANDRRNATRRKTAADQRKRTEDLKHYETKRGVKRQHDQLDWEAKQARTQQPPTVTTTVPQNKLLNPTQQSNAVAPASSGPTSPTSTAPLQSPTATTAAPRQRRPRASTTSTPAATSAAPAAATTTPAFKAETKPGVPDTTGIMSRFDSAR